jgi:hypothetical protein
MGDCPHISFGDGANVRFGSDSDIRQCLLKIGFTPESGHGRPLYEYTP